MQRLITLLSLAAILSVLAIPTQAADTITMVIMDPLSAPLSCPCVEGYAQRRYEVLGAHIEKATGTKVNVVWADALSVALKGAAEGKADIIIGKDSVVRADASKAKFTMEPIGRLTNKDGVTTQTGLIVVAGDDPAQKVSDLIGYKIIFGPAEADEKHAAAMNLLEKSNVPIPAKLVIDQACSDGACKVVDLGPKGQSAAVISSYAAPLLEGCGTIKKGDLRVVGETKPVPFVTAFVNTDLDKKHAAAVKTALLALGDEPKVCDALESLIGFVPLEEEATPQTTTEIKKKQ